MEIKPATLADCNAVIALWNKAGLLKPYHLPEEEFRSAVTGLTSAIFIAKENNAIIGTVLAGFEGHRGWIYRLAVDPDYRERGIGAQLMTHAERWIKTEFNPPHMMLLVREENSGVMDFYKKRGYAASKTTLLWKDLSE